MPTPEPDDNPGQSEPLYADAATRVSNPSEFDDWYYGIEDRIGQGTIGMGVCLIVFLVVLFIATTCHPI